MRESIHKYLLATAVFATLALADESHAQVIGIGEAVLRFEAVGSVSYYSNPYLRDKAFDSVLPVENSFAFIIDPTAILELGNDDSRYEINGSAGIAIRRFESITALDADDLHFNIEAAYRGDKSNWNLNAATKELSLPEQHTRSSDVTPDGDSSQFNWNGSYRYSTRTRLVSGIRYNKRSYSDSTEFNFSDWESFSVPVRFLYQMSEKMELGGGVRYRNRTQERFDQPSDLAWHLAIEGELSSKVTTDIKVGILDEDGSTNTSSADGDLFLSAQTRWQATEDSGVTLELESDSYSTGLNDSVLRERIALSADWRISSKLYAQGSLSKMQENFDSSPRKDKISRASFALNYRPSDSQLFSSASLSYEKNNSNIAGLNYKSLILNWTTGWRF